MAPEGFDPPPQRTHVTLEYRGKEEHIVRLPPRRPGEPKQLLVLKPGDNEVPLAQFHQFGRDPDTVDLMGRMPVRDAEGKETGVREALVVPVCRLHTVWIERHLGPTPDSPTELFCRDCGHTKDTAARAYAEELAAKPGPSDERRRVLLDELRTLTVERLIGLKIDVPPELKPPAAAPQKP